MKIKYPVSVLVLALSLQFIAPVTGVTLLTADTASAQAAEEGVGTGGGGPPRSDDSDTCGNNCVVADPPEADPDLARTTPPPPPAGLAAQGAAATGCGPAPATCNNGG